MSAEARWRPVVMVAYHYPPFDREVGGVRPSKFAKYLPACGWRPLVVTARPTRAGQPGGDVYTAREWPHPLKLYQRFRERRARAHGRADAFARKLSAPVTGDARRSPLLALKRLCLSFLHLPDTEVSWLIPAAWRAWRVIRASGARHLVTTGPPFTTHLVGLTLAWTTRVRWIADFRDPWEPDRKHPLRLTRLTVALERFLAGLVVRRADAVISVTPAMTRQLVETYPSIPAAKFITLTNGFDPDDFAGLPEQDRPARPVVFSYLGSFYSGRNPVPFLEALQALIDSERLHADEVRVHFAGDVSVVEGQSLAGVIASLGLDEVVSLSAPVPRHRALELARASHVLLAFTAPPHLVQRPVKLYEALAAGALVLHIGPHGDAARFLTSLERGMCASGEKPSELEETILACVERARRTPPRSAPPWRDPAVAPFAFPALTADLAGILATLPPSPRGERRR